MKPILTSSARATSSAARASLRTLSIAGPIAQGKFLLHEAIPNHLPGVAAIFGVLTLSTVLPIGAVIAIGLGIVEAPPLRE